MSGRRLPARVLRGPQTWPLSTGLGCTGAGAQAVAAGAHEPGTLAWKCRGLCLVTSDYGLGHISHTHASAGKVTLAVGVMNGRTVMKWRHQDGWREDGVWRTGRPHAAATRRIAQRPGAVKGEITHLLCLFLTATVPIHHRWGQGGTRWPISSMNYGTQKH